MREIKNNLGILLIEMLCDNCDTIHKIQVSGLKRELLHKLIFAHTFKPKIEGIKIK